MLYFSWTIANQSLQCQERLATGKTISTFSEWFQKTHQCILCPQAQEYVVVIPTKYKDLHSSTDCVDGFIHVVKQTDTMHFILVGPIVGLAHLQQENAWSDTIESVSRQNNLVYFDTYWTAYQASISEPKFAGGR